MNITNADFFTFNVDHSLLLVGQSGTGKSVLEDRYIERLLKAFTPNELQFILLDMTGVDFSQLRESHSDYIQTDVTFDATKGLGVLEQTTELAEQRASKATEEPLLVLLIEECDMAATDQQRFDSLLIRINRVAATANIKVIYSTSRPAPNVLSQALLASFDLILAGQLVDADYAYLGIQKPELHKPFEFIVSSKQT